MLGKLDLYTYFTEEHIRGVYAALSRLCHQICASAVSVAGRDGIELSLVVNGRSVYEAVISAYYDIARYKDFHLGSDEKKLSDGVKRAAYFTKWLLRFRPIQYALKDETPSEDKDDAWAQTLNEHLAIEWGLRCMTCDADYLSISPRMAFREDIVYTLHYRELGTDGLMTMYKLLSDLLKSGFENPFFEANRSPFSTAAPAVS